VAGPAANGLPPVQGPAARAEAGYEPAYGQPYGDDPAPDPHAEYPGQVQPLYAVQQGEEPYADPRYAGQPPAGQPGYAPGTYDQPGYGEQPGYPAHPGDTLHPEYTVHSEAGYGEHNPAEHNPAAHNAPEYHPAEYNPAAYNPADYNAAEYQTAEDHPAGYNPAEYAQPEPGYEQPYVPYGYGATGAAGYGQYGQQGHVPGGPPRPAEPMAPPPTAEEFAARRAHRPVAPEATMGVPALVRKLSFGMVAPAPSRRERDFREAVTKVRRNFGGLRQITVVNPKGGAGKTVAVLMTAMTFGQSRGGYVLAWDNNETQGTLGMRAQQDFHTRTVRDVLHELDVFMGIHGRVGDLSGYVRSQAEAMFDVLASDESATAGEMLTARAFADIREVVSRFYKLIIVDTGNNVRAENWQAAIDATDQLVVTMSARGDSAETAARMLDHLEQTGRDQLVRQAVTVVSMPASRKELDLPAIQRHFAARTRQVLVAPYERLLDSGEPIRYGEITQDSKDCWLKIAAAIAEGL
jgi:MinD-like ATPase involved in chromosome partitioning or flagellar assembly